MPIGFEIERPFQNVFVVFVKDDPEAFVVTQARAPNFCRGDLQRIPIRRWRCPGYG